MNSPAQGTLSLPWLEHESSLAAEPKQSHDSGCHCRMAKIPTSAKVCEDSSYNLQELRRSLGRAKGKLSKSGRRAVNTAFFCVAFRAVPFLLMVLIVFANKRRQGSRGHPPDSPPLA